jgi:hypothetical protein
MKITVGCALKAPCKPWGRSRALVAKFTRPVHSAAFVVVKKEWLEAFAIKYHAIMDAILLRTII